VANIVKAALSANRCLLYDKPAIAAHRKLKYEILFAFNYILCFTADDLFF